MLAFSPISLKKTHNLFGGGGLGGSSNLQMLQSILLAFRKVKSNITKEVKKLNFLLLLQNLFYILSFEEFWSNYQEHNMDFICFVLDLLILL